MDSSLCKWQHFDLLNATILVKINSKKRKNLMMIYIPKSGRIQNWALVVLVQYVTFCNCLNLKRLKLHFNVVLNNL